MTSLAVYMPTRGQPVYEAFAAATVEASNAGAKFHLARGEPIEHVRNWIVSSFLAGDATHLCMIDDDVIVPGGALPAMTELGKQVVTLPTPWLYDGQVRACNVSPFEACQDVRGRHLAGDKLDIPWPPWSWVLNQRAPFRVGATGFGCVVIERAVFDTHHWPGFTFTRALKSNHVGEDVHFSLWCLGRGIEMWAMPNYLAGHVKAVDLRDFVPFAEVAHADGANWLSRID